MEMNKPNEELDRIILFSGDTALLERAHKDANNVAINQQGFKSEGFRGMFFRG